MDLINALKSQNDWWKTGRVPAALLKETKRDEFEKAVSLLDDERIISIIGPRRTGKTTLLYQIINYLSDENIMGVKSSRILFFSADDPSFRPHTESLFEDIFKTYYEDILMEGKREGKVYIFIDEVQFYNGWELWLKKYYDLKFPIKFIISSSSSAHLSTASRESLVGRIIEILVLPLNFKGYLSLLNDNKIKELIRHNSKITNSDFENINAEKRFELLKYEDEIKILFQKYLLFGGLPESISEKEILLWQEKLISDILRKVIYRDIVSLYHVRTPSKLEDLFIYLVYNTSSTFSYSSISKNLGISIESVINYLTYLLEAYLIGELKLFSKSIEKTLRANRKYFVMDSGLQNTITKISDLTETNIGFLIESAIQKHLFVFAESNHFKIYYWRDKEEVDIIMDTKKSIIPFEVKYKNNIRKDDLKGLLKFMDKFKLNVGYVITKDLLENRIIEEKEIRFIPAWLFLLNF